MTTLPDLETLRKELQEAKHVMEEDTKSFAIEARRLKVQREQEAAMQAEETAKKKLETEEIARIERERRQIARANDEIKFVRKLIVDKERFGLGASFDARVKAVLDSEYKLNLVWDDIHYDHCRDCQAFFSRTVRQSSDYENGYCDACKDRWCSYCGVVPVDQPSRCASCKARSYSPPCRHA